MCGYDDLLPRVLEALPRDEKFFLLGESFGGPLSIRVAASRPAGLQGLILCATFLSCPHDFVPRWAASLVPSFALRGLGSAVRVRALLGRYATPELTSLFRRTLSSVSARLLAHRLREVIRVDVSREFAGLDLPVLYLQGATDYVVPHNNLRKILRIRPDVQHVQLSAPHMLLQTAPDVAARAVTRFMGLAEPVQAS